MIRRYRARRLRAVALWLPVGVVVVVFIELVRYAQ